MLWDELERTTPSSPFGSKTVKKVVDFVKSLPGPHSPGRSICNCLFLRVWCYGKGRTRKAPPTNGIMPALFVGVCTMPGCRFGVWDNTTRTPGHRFAIPPSLFNRPVMSDLRCGGHVMVYTEARATTRSATLFGPKRPQNHARWGCSELDPGMRQHDPDPCLRFLIHLAVVSRPIE